VSRFLQFSGWIPAIVVLILVTTTPPFASPDGIEAVAAGACVLTPGADCVGLELWFWPPALGLIGGALSHLGLSVSVAATLLSLGFGALAMVPLGRLAARIGGPLALWLAPMLVLCVPDLRLHLMMGDARPIALFGLLWAWELTLSRGRVGWIAAACALAVLARTESLAPIGLLFGYGLIKDYKSWRNPRTWLVFLLLMAPYWLALSWVSGHPSLSSQGWQSQVYPWLDQLPMTWLELDLAAGARDTPFRLLLSSGSGAGVPGGSPPLGLDLWVLRKGMRHAVAWWCLPLCVFSLRQGQASWAALLLALPALAITALMPQAQDFVLPAKNLLPMGWAVALLAGGGLARLSTRIRLPKLGLGVVTLALAASLPQQGMIGGDARLSNGLFSDLPQGSVAAALSTAPEVLRSGRTRRRLPSPWAAKAWLEGPERSNYLVFSSQDLPFIQRSLAVIQENAELEVHTIRRGPVDSVVLVAIEPRGPKHDSGAP
jgi:hypothetical protein